MALQFHSKAGAFSPGSHLWVLPQISISSWTRTIDWYLNFQVSRMENHELVEMSGTLKDILDSSGIESLPSQLPENPPLLLASSTRLPNDQTVILQFDERIDEWFKRVKLIWYKLNRPKMRIFLPVELKESEIIRFWPNMDEQHLVSFVPSTEIQH